MNSETLMHNMFEFNNHIQQINSLCKKYKVKTLYAFGSAVTTNFNTTSDIDFIVSFNDVPIENYAENFFSLKEEMEGALKRNVDLVTEKSIQNPYFIKTIEKTKMKMYEG